MLGLTAHENLGLPDGEVDNTIELREQIGGARIRALQPDTVVSCDPTAVFFGSRYVNHHDHRSVGFAVLDACAPAAASPLYFPHTGPAASGECRLPVGHPGARRLGGHLDHRRPQGRGAHLPSQPGGGRLDLVDEVVRRRAASAGADAGLDCAEAFRILRFRF